PDPLRVAETLGAAAATATTSRRRRSFRRRVAGGAVPYLLVAPVLAVLGAILGYPIYNPVQLPLQRYGLFELIPHPGVYTGVLNYMLTELHVGDYFQHNWYVTPFSQLSMATTLVVWGALPFVVITVYAALSQVSRELVEAAEIDGAASWRVFKDVTMPVITP